jgi:hypothetical protein
MRSMPLDSMSRVLLSLSSPAVVGVAAGALRAAPCVARGRPAGDVSQALLSAAAAAPATVRELAARACVGYGAARYTATRLVSRGALVPVAEGRPMVLAAAAARSFWEEGAAEGGRE